MSNGYLGKISAIVSANTGDFAAKLNGSAKEVKRFASTVESTIGAASRAASSSLANIYTPLQKLERAIQAASSMKLSFNGFAGAIKDIDALKQRMTSLNQRQISVILKASGLESINKFQDAVQGLNSKQFDILLRVGGVEKLKQIKEQIAAGQGEFQVVAQTKEAEAQVKALQQQINELKKAGPAVITVDADAVTAAQRELNSFVRAQSKALTGTERPTPKRFRSDIESRLASEQAGLEMATGRQAERDRLMAAATSDRARKNIGKNYSGVDDDVSARVAAIEKLKAAMAELEQREKALAAARAGTSSDSGLKEYEAQLVSATQRHKELSKEASKRISAAVGIDISGDELEKVLSGAIERGEILERVFKEAGFEGTAAFERVVAVLKDLGVSDMEATLAKFRQMASVTEEITKPLSEASKAAAGLGAEVQAKVLPTLGLSQAAVEELVQMIKSGVAPASAVAEVFAKIRDQVSGAAKDVAQLAEASKMLGQLKTGDELAFARPDLSEAIGRGAQIGSRAAELPASAIRQNPGIVSGLVEINKLSNDAVAVFAKLQAKAAAGLSLTATEAELQKLLAKLAAVQDKASNEIKVLVDTEAARKKVEDLKKSLADVRESVSFTVTGQVQNFDQAKQEGNRLQSAVGSLPSGRSAFSDRLQKLGGLVETGDVAELQQVRDLIADIDSSLRERKQLDIDDAKAKARLDQLTQSIDELRQKADFVITGRPQNLDQVQAELNGILGDIRKVEDADRGGLKVHVDAVIEALGRQDLDAANEELEKLRTAAAAVIPVKVNTSAAVDRIEEINKAWDMAVRQVPTTVDQIDAEFRSLASRIGKLDLADRLDLDPLIREFRDSAAAGEPLIAQFERLLALQGQLDGIESRSNPSGAFGPDIPGGFGGSSDAGLGREVGDPQRRLDVLRGQITAVKGQVDQLPASVQARFIPALLEAEAEFRRLAATANALPADIDAAADRMQRLTAEAGRASDAMNFRNRFGGGGIEGINRGLDQQALRGYEAQLQILMRTLGRVREDARGPGVAAFNALAEAIANAMEAGNLRAPDTQRRIQQLMREATNAIGGARGSGTSASALGREVNRAGDVGRRGVDNFSLALNQAAFAVDDFMSSTGGVEFKLRAVSNNISQLAFILGGTTGLFIGLGAVISAQAGIALMKWANNGKTAEDRTKALNDALSRQKSLVEDVASAFRSLAKELSQGVVSEAGGRMMAIEEFGRKQKAARDSRASGANRDTIESSSNVAQLERELNAESTPGRRALLEDRLKQARAEESRSRRRAAATPADFDVSRSAADEIEAARGKDRSRLSLVGALDTVLGLGMAKPVSNTFDYFLGTGARDSQLRRIAGGARAGDDVEAQRSRLESLRQENRELGRSADRRVFGVDFFNESADAEKRMAKNAEQIAIIEAKLGEAIDAAVGAFVDSIQNAASAVRQAQNEAAEAIKAGIPGAREFAAEVDAVGRLLKDAERVFGEAQDEADPVWKQRREADARAMSDEAMGKRDQLQAQADQLRSERIADPQRQIDAKISRTRQNIGGEDGQLARRLRELEAQREAVRRMAATATTGPERERVVQAEMALNEQVVALEAASIAVKAFTQSLDQARSAVKSNLSSAERTAEAARRADTARSTPRTREDLAMAEADLQRQREVARQAEVEIEVATARRREEMDADPRAARVRDISEELGRDIPIERREELIRERSRLQGQMEDEERAKSQATRDFVDSSSVKEAEDSNKAAEGRDIIRSFNERETFRDENAAGLDKIRQYFINKAENETGLFDQEGFDKARSEFFRRRNYEWQTATPEGRGRLAGMTDRERFGEEILKPGGLIESITARRRQLEAQGENRGDQAKFLQGAIREQMESIAPMVAGFADERMTAALQGPSRAKLEVADVTTTQGMSELNRMLRGDDPSKDVNLAELRKQTDKLDDVIRAIQQSNPGVIP